MLWTSFRPQVFTLHWLEVLPQRLLVSTLLFWFSLLTFTVSYTVGLDDIRSFIMLRRIEAQAELTLKSIKFEAATVFAQLQSHYTNPVLFFQSLVEFDPELVISKEDFMTFTTAFN